MTETSMTTGSNPKFCSMLLPEELRAYYADKFAITSTSGCEQKISTFGLINMDEFDQYNERMMAILKNLMQMKKVNYRKCFKAYYSDLPRIASFIGTSNEKSLLTNETGSRRFLCIEVLSSYDYHKMIMKMQKSVLLFLFYLRIYVYLY